MAQLGGRLSPLIGGRRPSVSVRKVSISRTIRASAGPPQHGADMIGVDFDRLVDLMVQPRAALGATIPSRRDQKASVGTGGLPSPRGNGGSLTSWPAIRSYSSRTLVLVL